MRDFRGDVGKGGPSVMARLNLVRTVTDKGVRLLSVVGIFL
jgi:hypothetical protein